MAQLINYLQAAGRFILPALALILVLRCCFSLIRNRPRNKPMGVLVNALNGDKIFLDRWETSIGRSKSCDITLGYGTVSRFHAVVSRRKNGWTVTDTGSKTGTFVNAHRINGRTYLNDGDAIMFGDAVLFFSAPDAVAQQEPEQADEAPAPHHKAPAIVAPDGTVYPLRGGSYAIGRAPESDIHLNFPAVSRSHASILVAGDGYAVADMGSKSGTFINGRRIVHEQPLYDGDTIRVGGMELVYYEDYHA